MSDDALIADIARAISGSGVTSPASLRKARAALTVARKAILEEAASMVERSYDGACYENISRHIAADIRSLANHEKHND